jgi:hypothetical protein
VNYYKNTNSVKNLYILLPLKRKKSLNFRYLKDGTGFAYIIINSFYLQYLEKKRGEAESCRRKGGENR